jgi:hypothetical protein
MILMIKNYAESENYSLSKKQHSEADNKCTFPRSLPSIPKPGQCSRTAGTYRIRHFGRKISFGRGTLVSRKPEEILPESLIMRMTFARREWKLTIIKYCTHKGNEKIREPER